MHDQDHHRDRNTPPTRVRYVMLAGLCLAASVAYLCRNSIGVAESTIREELGMSEVAMSWVMSSFFLAYALAQIPTGWWGDRWGSRRAIPLFCLAWSLATGTMSLAFGMPLLLGSRIGNGLAQAGLFPACTSTIGTWFPETRRVFSSGALASCMSLGGAFGVAITGALVVQIGWRTTFLCYGAVGIVFAIAFYVLFRDTPEEHPWVNEAERAFIGQQASKHNRREDPDWLGVFFSPATWWICGQQFCRAAGQIFFSSWFATYLQETRDVPVDTSGFLNCLPLVGIVTGSLIGGAVSDLVLVRTRRIRLARSGVALTSMFLCAAFVFIAYFIEHPLLAVITISLGTFCASIGGASSYAVTIDMGGGHTAILFATMNTVGNLGAFAFIRLVPETTRYLSWDAVLVMFGLFYVAAAMFWMLIDPRDTVVQQSLYRRNN